MSSVPPVTGTRHAAKASIHAVKGTRKHPAYNAQNSIKENPGRLRVHGRGQGGVFWIVPVADHPKVIHNSSSLGNR